MSWAVIGLAGVGIGVFLLYTQVWPALQAQLYRPSAVRDYLLPPSTQPVSVVAGVGVGWFWILCIAAPVAAMVAAGLWWALLAAGNRRVRRGGDTQLQAGQKWQGEQFAAGPLIVVAAAVVLAGIGALIRWMGPAASTMLGLIISMGLLLVSAAGYVQFVRWALARAHIARQIASITYLCSPALGWSDLRGGRVLASNRTYPPRRAPFPGTVTLFYGQHPRGVTEDVIGEVSAALTQITTRTYRIDHDPLRRTLMATETEIVTHDPVLDGSAVLAPLVASWFDPAAHLVTVRVSRADEDDAAADEDADEDVVVVGDGNSIAARIESFIVEFAYNTKVSTPFRRGVIESAVSDVLGGAWEAEWKLPARTVTFTRCPGLPMMVAPPLELPAVTRSTIRTLYQSTSIPFAVDAYGKVISWNFKDSPHMLVCGPTSTGKTSLLMTIGLQCAGRGINVVWLDPKAFDSPGLRAWPNFSLVTEGVDDNGMACHTAALRFIADTMRERYAQIMINPDRAKEFDPIVVVSDEFANLVMELAKFYIRFKNTKVDKGRPPTEDDVGTILRTARAVGINMVIGLQRPDTTFIAGEARDNTALRVAMGRLRSKDAAVMMFNNPTAGTRVQPGIKGRGTVQLPDNSIREIQVYYTPTPPATDTQRAALSDADRHVLESLSAVNSFWPRRVVDSALRYYDPTDSEGPDMSFAAIRDSPIVLAADRPDLDVLSDQYVRPRADRRPTMDDDHHLDESSEAPAIPAVQGASTFGAPVDGFDDDYLPTVDDEYGPPMPATADEISFGDLVDVSVDGVMDWKYVHADPYPCGDEDGDDRIVIPYRDLDDSRAAGDIDVEPHAVMQVRKLNMH